MPTNRFDGQERIVDGVTWRHGNNEQFEFWTHEDDRRGYDIARLHQEQRWSVYQHIHGHTKKTGSTYTLNSMTRHLDGSFTHGPLYHVDPLDPEALIRATSILVPLRRTIEGEIIRSDECDACRAAAAIAEQVDPMPPCPACGMECAGGEDCGCTDDCTLHGTTIGKALKVLRAAAKTRQQQTAFETVYKHIYPNA